MRAEGGALLALALAGGAAAADCSAGVADLRDADTTLRFTSWEHFTADLGSLGVGYVIAPTAIVSEPASLPIGTTGAVSNLVAADEIEVLSRLLRERGEALATAADYSLFRIDPRS